MTKNIKNTDGLYDSFISPSFLEYDMDFEFLEWYSLEGSERISELSRQLRTFLNYKSSIISLRFSRSQKEGNIFKEDLLVKYRGEFFLVYSRYSILLKSIGVDEETIAEKIRILMEKVKIQPNDLEINQLKEIKYLGEELWKNIHILSGFEFHSHSRLLHMAIKIACILCTVEGVFFSLFSDFYGELKWSYLQLEKELSALLCLNENQQFKTKKKKRQVRILE